MFRYYDPTIGKYITSDPIGLIGGFNTYSYALQNPIRYIDSKGLCPICPLLIPLAGGSSSTAGAGVITLIGTNLARLGLSALAIGALDGIADFFDPGEGDDGPSDDPFECIQGCREAGEAARASCSALFKAGLINEVQLVDCFLATHATQEACVESCQSNCG